MSNELARTGPLAGRFVSKYSKMYWRTQEGDRIQFAFMRTEHMFFCFRMLYDVVAARKGWPLMRKVGEGRQGNPGLSDSTLAKRMAYLATDIDARGDLAEEHREQFRAMMINVLGLQKAIAEGEQQKCL